MLISDFERRNIVKIEHLISINSNKPQRIFLNKLYELPKYRELKRPFIIFPLVSDLVIYKIRENADSEFEYYLCILGANVHKNDTYRNFSIEIPKQTGESILEWFEEVWSLFDKN